MSVNKWAYEPSKCDGDYCVGDCDLCDKAMDTSAKGYVRNALEDSKRIKGVIRRAGCVGCYAEKRCPDAHTPIAKVCGAYVHSSEDAINHPKHYTDGKIEVIDFIEDKKLPYHLGNVIKYVCRAGKKDPLKEVEDLQKAQWYLERYIEMRRGKQ